MPDRRTSNLVEQAFWDEEYLGDLALPSRPDRRIPFERCLAEALAEHAPVEPNARVLEVGCAPAKWLVFYAERFGTTVEGIESSEKGAALSRENLRLAGLEGAIHQADFFACTPREFDLVLSLGFIEHFDDLQAAFARHVEFLAPGGRLAVGVPNYRGLNHLVQWWSDRGHLRLHNLEAMDPAAYRRLAVHHGLELEHIGHLGGFDPIIIKLGRPSAALFTLAEGRYRRLRVADRLNHRWLSSYLLAVLRRPSSLRPKDR